ncbi:hypothetical protein [Burkholderia anthinoferrum]|uniref:hypothetical protein n=1 Tax=Burkholderia anthinoferrum TaxID=3090833 RepID=UPI0015E28312|nr:hypothetical protein [Burkholderia anthinoferrum]
MQAESAAFNGVEVAYGAPLDLMSTQTSRLNGPAGRTKARAPDKTGFSMPDRGRELIADRPVAAAYDLQQPAKRPTSRLHTEATGKLGQPKQQLYAGSMTTLSPEAFAGHTPMMQRYLRLI